jgi:hypothetical protein
VGIAVGAYNCDAPAPTRRHCIVIPRQLGKEGRMMSQQRTVRAAIVLQWWERVAEHHRHHPDAVRARALDNALYWVCRANGAIRVAAGDGEPSPVGDRTFWIESGPNADFDWVHGEIVFRGEAIDDGLGPDHLIAELEAFTGINAHDAAASGTSASSFAKAPVRAWQDPWGGGRDEEVTEQTLAAWRSALEDTRDDERERDLNPSEEPARLLRRVHQALNHGAAALAPDDVARIEELTGIDAEYTQQS